MSDPETPNLQEGSSETEEHEPEAQFLPPPTFEFLVLSLSTQCQMQLGLLHFGEEKDRPKPHLELAQHTIDMLAMISDKTRGNLTMEEQRLLENSLTELRFRYVQAAEELQKST